MTKKPKTQKEETRWCIEFPSGEWLYQSYTLRKDAISEFWHHAVECGMGDYPWSYWRKQGYKCVKIKIRRAKC